MKNKLTDLKTVAQARRAYFKWLGRNSFPSKTISDAAQACGMHLMTLERTRNPSGVVVESAKEAFAELEKMLGVR